MGEIVGQRDHRTIVAILAADILAQVAPPDLCGRGTQPMERGDRGEGIVDPGRQRAQPDLDQFVDQELGILFGCPGGAERETAADAFIDGRGIAAIDIQERHVAMDEVARAHA